MWKHFSFTSGCNPYITKDEKAAEKAQKIWKKNGYSIEKIQEGFYLVDDRGKSTDLF